MKNPDQECSPLCERDFRVLGLIPARGGSKGVPRKNARLLGGKPLLCYTAEAALKASTLSRIVLSTDDREIAEIGCRCGIDVPFLRPEFLADDRTPMIAVVLHAMAKLEDEGDSFSAVCILQPTTPFRDPCEIDATVSILRDSDADCVMTVRPVPSEHNPHWVYFANADGSLRLSTGEAVPIPGRQALPPAYHRDGSVYAIRRSAVMERGTLYGDKVAGYINGTEPFVNIDTPQDWERAEEIARRWQQ